MEPKIDEEFLESAKWAANFIKDALIPGSSPECLKKLVKLQELIKKSHVIIGEIKRVDDADRLLFAVNSHDELMEAAKKLLAQLNFISLSGLLNEMNKVHHCQINLEKAIQKAEGK